MKKGMIMMVLTLAGWLGSTVAQTPAVVWSDKSGWHKIAEKMVDLKMDHDEVLVMGADKFSALKFKVVDAPIEILEAEVIFEKDDAKRDKARQEKTYGQDMEANTRQSIPVNTPLQAGTETRVFELTGSRDVKKISFRYKTLPNAKDMRARVEIWGFKSAEQDKTEEIRPEM